MADSKQAVAQGRGRDRRGGVFRRRQLRAQGEQEIPENLFARGFHPVCGLRYCEQSAQLLRRNFAAGCDRRCTSSQSAQSRALTISADSHRQSHPPTIPARWRGGPRSNPPSPAAPAALRSSLPLPPRGGWVITRSRPRRARDVHWRCLEFGSCPAPRGACRSSSMSANRSSNTNSFGCGQVIPVSFRGRKGGYTHCMFLNDEGPIAGGRELWGFPKKLANPSLKTEVDTLVGKLDYGPVRVATGTMGYKHRPADLSAIKASLEASNFLLEGHSARRRQPAHLRARGLSSRRRPAEGRLDRPLGAGADPACAGAGRGVAGPGGHFGSAHPRRSDARPRQCRIRLPVASRF
jgi:hypothetical protein